jgi:RNA polymerase sigma-70 factor (ECF subfamily)
MTVDPPREDDDLVAAVQGGDRSAFSELVERHQQQLWLVCRQYVGSDEADSATQDTLLKAWTAIGSFDGRAALSTWLVRIAINTCLDRLRRRRRRGAHQAVDDRSPEGASPLERLPDGAAGPEDRSMQRQAVDRLAALERDLPPRQREVFRLRFYAELELEEIAASLGVHVGTVKTQLHRAVHRLRRELGDVR